MKGKKLMAKAASVIIPNGYQSLSRIAIWIFPIIVGIALAIGAYQEKQNALIIKTDATNIRVSAIETLVATNCTEIAVMGQNIKNIKEALDRIENKLDIEK